MQVILETVTEVKSLTRMLTATLDKHAINQEDNAVPVIIREY